MKAVHHIPCRTVRPGILRTFEMLPQKAVEFRADLSHGSPMGNRELADILKSIQRKHNEYRHAEPDDPVFPEQQEYDANHQQSIRQQIDDKAGEKVAQCIDVPIHPLDDRAGGLGFMKRHIQPQTVLRHIAAQLVCRDPADVLANVGGRYRYTLQYKRCADE